jgi:N-acetylglucosamine malate deacetylase 1
MWRDLSKMKVLALSPHTDDFEIGAGGALLMLIENQAHVRGVAFSACQEHVPACFDSNVLLEESEKAFETLTGSRHNLRIHNLKVDRLPEVRQNICELLWQLNQAEKYDLVFCPASTDLHQDHHVIYEETCRIFKRTTILGYELPWNALTLEARAFYPISAQNAARKIDVLTCYQSQAHKKFMRPEAIANWMRFRGMQIDCEYAEAFEVIRWIM